MRFILYSSPAMIRIGYTCSTITSLNSPNKHVRWCLSTGGDFK